MAEIRSTNQELGDDASKMMYAASVETRNNRPDLVEVFHGTFSGLRTIPLGKLPDVANLHMYTEADGIGTKVEVAERLEDHSVSAFNLFAMACDDVAVRGGEPVGIDTILDVNRLDDSELVKKAIRELAVGSVAAAKAARVVILTGEVAELGDRVNGYGPFNYNWAASVLWFGHKDRLLTGHEIKPGDSLVGLADPGFRSNGITDVRKAMLENYGDNWHNQVERSVGDVTLGKLVQTPSVIYSGFLAKLTGGYDITKEPAANVTGVAHITGGGIPGKLGRMLEPSGLGAVIDEPIDPPAIMAHVQSLRGFSDEQSYRKWHMGPGMIIATSEPDKVVERAVMTGIGAKRIGEVTDEPGIRIKNRGLNQEEEWLVFTKLD